MCIYPKQGNKKEDNLFRGMKDKWINAEFEIFVRNSGTQAGAARRASTCETVTC